MESIKKFENKFGIKLPTEIKSLYNLITDGYDYETFYFKLKDECFFLLRNIYTNNAELLKINFPAYDKASKLVNIIQNEIDQLIGGSNAFFGFAYNPTSNVALGYFYQNNEFKGVHTISIAKPSSVEYIAKKIEPDLFENLSYDHEFRFYQSYSRILYEQQKLNVPEFIETPSEAIFLYSKHENLDLKFYTDILSNHEYIITDSEWFDDDMSYQLLLRKINNLTKGECQFVGNKNLQDVDERNILINQNVIQEYIGTMNSDYINPNFFDLLNRKIEHIRTIKKEIVQFWDIRFGQEIGVAFIDQEKKENLSKIGSSKIYNFKTKEYSH